MFIYSEQEKSQLLKKQSTSVCFISSLMAFFLNFFLFLSAAFIAALYIDKDLEYVHTFMNVCFFPRLKVSSYS